MASLPHKTPYEIRLNLLQLAQQIERDRMAAESMSEQERENPVPTKAPSIEEVIKAAGKLNNFVSQSNTH